MKEIIWESNVSKSVKGKIHAKMCKQTPNKAKNQQIARTGIFFLNILDYRVGDEGDNSKLESDLFSGFIILDKNDIGPTNLTLSLFV